MTKEDRHKGMPGINNVMLNEVKHLNVNQRISKRCFAPLNMTVFLCCHPNMGVNL